MFYFPLNRLDNEAAGKGGNTEVRDSSVPHSPIQFLDQLGLPSE